MTENWVFKHSMLPLILVTFSYLYFVLKCGPRYMENRPPYKLTTFIKYYNIAQIVLNSWIVYSLVNAGWTIDNVIFTRTQSSSALKINVLSCIYVGWTTLALKIFDFVETGVFVLRKKQNQISFLHLYHHITTVWLSWIYAKFFVFELALTIICLNCGVHVIMYSYYLFASLGYMTNVLRRVKPYITIIQMVQFVIIIAYLIQGIFLGTTVNKTIGVITLLDVIINFTLFYNFYKENYTKVNK